FIEGALSNEAHRRNRSQKNTLLFIDNLYQDLTSFRPALAPQGPPPSAPITPDRKEYRQSDRRRPAAHRAAGDRDDGRRNSPQGAAPRPAPPWPCRIPCRPPSTPAREG